MNQVLEAAVGHPAAIEDGFDFGAQCGDARVGHDFPVRRITVLADF
jgi:hypothetical protein